MPVIKERLKWSMIALLSIPYAFIIVCGVLSFYINDIYSYLHVVLLIFLGLIVVLSLNTWHYFSLFRKLKKKSEDNETIEEIVIQTEESVNEFANVIGKDTHFIGDIQTSNDILILGSFKGEIKSTADVYVDGMAEGSITCRNLSMNEAIVNADINCYKEVFVDALSVIRGNVHTDVLLHHGKIKGNIDIEGHMELSTHCVILGDICAREIEFPQGAQIHGDMNIKK